MSRPRYVLELEATDDDPPPDGVRLRKLLKRLLRCYGLECLDVRELPAAAGAVPPDAEASQAAAN